MTYERAVNLRRSVAAINVKHYMLRQTDVGQGDPKELLVGTGAEIRDRSFCRTTDRTLYSGRCARTKPLIKSENN